MDPSASLLLVGASGRVGRMVSYHWPSQPDGVDTSFLVSSRRPLAQAPNPRTHHILWSPLSGPAGLIAQLDLQGHAPAALVMLAGVTPRRGLDPSALAGNALLAKACLQAASAAGIGRVLLASSSAVYGAHPRNEAFTEGSQTYAVSPYGLAKLDMEAAARPWRDKGVQVCALRIGNVAGADALLGQINEGDDLPPLKIDAFDDALGPLRSYIGPATLAQVLHALALRVTTLPEVLNLAAPVPVRMTALAEAARLPFMMAPAKAGAHQNITLDCGLLQSLVSLTPDDSDPVHMVQQWQATLS